MSKKNGTITRTFTYEGKRYYVRGKTEKEALMKLANKKRDLEEGKVIVGSTMSVKAWTDIAIKTYKSSQAEITRTKFTRLVNHNILEQLGHLPLKSVKPIHCQNCLNLCAGKSKAHINAVYQALRFIFSKAVENNLILTNPAEYIVRPNGYKNHRRSITDAERKALLSVAKKIPKLRIFAIMLYTGCRPSEAINLMGYDVVKINGKPMLHIRGTKTATADRYVPLVPEAYEILKNVRKDALIFTAESGAKYNEQSFKRLTHRLKREMNIKMGCKMYRNKLIPPYPLAQDFVPYCLRHTFCTDLQKAGVDIRVAQKLMGHASIEMTANIYTHVDMEEIQKAGEMLSGAKSATVSATPCNTKLHQII